MTVRQYKRSVGMRFGPGSVVQAFDLAARGAPLLIEGVLESFSNLDDDGIRIQFDFLRTATGVPDKGVVKLWNLSEPASKSIVQDFELLKAARIGVFRANLPDDAARAVALDKINKLHRIQVFAGYQKRPELVFLGDYVDVKARKRVNRKDFVTEITLGDTILSLRSSFLNQGLGFGVSLLSVLEFAASTAAVRVSEDTKVRVQLLAPTSTVTAFQNGAMAAVRTPEMIDEIADLLGMQWFVRENVLYMMPQGGVIQDFALQITEGRDLLDFSQTRSDDEISGRLNMAPRVEPGRGIVIVDAFGIPTGSDLWRVQTARYVADTHGAPFYTSFVARKALEPLPAPLAGLVG